VPASKSLTIAEAADNWIAYVKGEGRERTTIDSYELHLRLYIRPLLRDVKLAEFTTPAAEAFRDKLLRPKPEGGCGLSRPMARKVLGSLKMLLGDAVRRGHAPFNAAAPTKIATDKRGKKKLQAGRDFPLTTEVGRIVAAAPDVKARALLMVLAFCDLRGSEIRGLPWTSVTLGKNEGTLAIEQRADRFGTIGPPKSEAGYRTIPFGPQVANALRQLKAQSAGRKLVFGTENDKPDSHSNLVQRIFQRAQIEAGVVCESGKAKYLGLHTLRHFAASFMLHRREDGGLGVTLKQTQERLGHATLAMTADLYGHLLPVEDDSAGLAAAERHLFAVA